MALDEPKDDDTSVDTGTLSFVMAPEVETVVSQNGGVVIDYIDDGMRKGYTVTLGSAAEGGCGDGGCGDGGCG